MIDDTERLKCPRCKRLVLYRNGRGVLAIKPVPIEIDPVDGHLVAICKCKESVVLPNFKFVA